jgi:hypothetical protein
VTPNLDLMLGTIERALATSILPSAADAAAKEEASLAILFTRWVREVLDQVPAAERSSYRECRAALDEVASRLEHDPANGSALELVRESRLSLLDADRALPAELRQATRSIKALLGRTLHTLRADGQASLANEVRARLYELGLREIERERAFGRASTIDPDWPSIPSLAELALGEPHPRRQTK